MNILIIDDNMINNRIMYHLLKKNNNINNIIIALDGVDGLNIINNINKLDIIVTDNQMPKMDGLTLVRLLRQQNYNKLIFGLSSSKSKEFEDSGIDYLFEKPFTIHHKEILFKFIDKLDFQRQLDKKLTLINSKLIWI
jgi:CheY-like chemotaxis protein